MLRSESYEQFEQGNSVKNDLYDWVEAAVFAVVCMVLVFTFIARTISVSGASMENTLHDGDRLINSRLFYTPTYKDIVVITQPNAKGEPIIKRVIATAGQTIDIEFNEGIVQVDGKVLNEPYIKDLTYNEGQGVTYPLTIPEGYVFVMGDNRNNSWDSRDQGIGLIDERYILGRVITRISPLKDLGDPDKYWEDSSTVGEN